MIDENKKERQAMKIVSNLKSLTDAINWVVKDYDNKDDGSYILLEVTREGLGKVSYFGSSYMSSSFSVINVDLPDLPEEESKVSIPLDGQFMKRLAGALSSDGEVTISKNLKNLHSACTLTTSTGKFTLPVVKASAQKDPQTVVIGDVDDHEFFSVLTKMSKMCETDRVGTAHFTGAVDLVFVPEKGEDDDKSTVVMFATDRFAMGQVKIEYSSSESTEGIDGKHILLPYPTASMISPTRGVSAPVTVVAENDNDGNIMRFGYKFQDGREALFPLLDTEPFTGVENMKNKSLEKISNSIVVNVSELTKAIKTVSSLAWDEDSIGIVIDKKNKLTVSDMKKQNKVVVSGENMDTEDTPSVDVSFSRNVLEECFYPVSTSKVKVKWGTDVFIFTPVDEEDNDVDTTFIMAIHR